jgi:hypothetical protein
MEQNVEIPKWCIGDAVNSFRHVISKEQQAKVRDWYLTHLPDNCEVIKEVKSKWIGGHFGTQYYSPSSLNEWDGFRLYVGEDIYVKLNNNWKVLT